MLKNFHSNETLPSVNVLDGTTPVKHVGTCALALQRAGAADGHGWSEINGSTVVIIVISYWLVVSTPLKNMSSSVEVSWDDYSQ